MVAKVEDASPKKSSIPIYPFSNDHNLVNHSVKIFSRLMILIDLISKLTTTKIDTAIIIFFRVYDKDEKICGRK